MPIRKVAVHQRTATFLIYDCWDYSTKCINDLIGLSNLMHLYTI